MRIATIRWNHEEMAGVVTEKGILPVAAINTARGTQWQEKLFDLIDAGQLKPLTDWYNAGGREELEKMPGAVPREQVIYAPLYRNPRRIFGIGGRFGIGNRRFRTGVAALFFKSGNVDDRSFR